MEEPEIMPNTTDRRRLKDRIVESISKAVKNIQLLESTCAAGGSDQEQDTLVLRNSDWQFCKLVEHLDHAFLHGLRKVPAGYWAVVQEFTHKSTIREISHLTRVITDLGRSRAWLYQALIDHLLESYIRCYLDNPKRIRSFYEQDALVLDEQRLQLILTLSGGIERVRFELELDVPHLDLTSHQPLPTLCVDDDTDSIADCSLPYPAMKPPIQRVSPSPSISSFMSSSLIEVPDADQPVESVEVIHVSGVSRAKKKQNGPRRQHKTSTTLPEIVTSPDSPESGYRSIADDSSTGNSTNNKSSSSGNSVTSGNRRPNALVGLAPGNSHCGQSPVNVNKPVMGGISRLSPSAPIVTRSTAEDDLLRSILDDFQSNLIPSKSPVGTPSRSACSTPTMENKFVTQAVTSAADSPTVVVSNFDEETSNSTSNSTSGSTDAVLTAILRRSPVRDVAAANQNKVTTNKSSNTAEANACRANQNKVTTNRSANTGESNAGVAPAASRPVAPGVKVSPVCPVVPVAVAPSAGMSAVVATSATSLAFATAVHDDHATVDIPVLPEDKPTEIPVVSVNRDRKSVNRNAVIMEDDDRNIDLRELEDGDGNTAECEKHETESAGRKFLSGDEISIYDSDAKCSQQHQHQSRQPSPLVSASNSNTSTPCHEGNLPAPSAEDSSKNSSSKNSTSNQDLPNQSSPEKPKVPLVRSVSGSCFGVATGAGSDVNGRLSRSPSVASSNVSLDLMTGHPSEIRVDNNLKLVIMLDIFQYPGEKYFKMYRCSTGHSEGDLRALNLLITDSALYLLSAGPGACRLKKDAVVTFTEIDYISLSIDSQIINIVCKARRKQFWVCTGDEDLTRCVLESIDQASRLNDSQTPSISVLTDATTHRIAVRKHAAKECHVEMPDVSVLGYFLVHWEDTLSLKKAQLVVSSGSKEGLLFLKSYGYSHNLMFGGGTSWVPTYFKLKDGVLYQFDSDTDRTSPRSKMSLRQENCQGCRRSKSNRDRSHCFEILFANGPPLELSALSSEDETDWINTLCMAVSSQSMTRYLKGTGCVACSCFVTEDRLFFCHEDIQTNMMRTIGSVAVALISAVYTDTSDTNADANSSCFCILSFESSSQKSVRKEKWAVYFYSAAETNRFIATLGMAYDNKVKRALCVESMDRAMSTRCHDGVATLSRLLRLV